MVDWDGHISCDCMDRHESVTSVQVIKVIKPEYTQRSSDLFKFVALG